MVQSFSAAVGDWALKAKGAMEDVFKESAQELVSQMDQLLVDMVYRGPPAASGYKRTGFLRASLMASTESMPQLVRDNPGVSVPADFGDLILVINGSELGGTLYFGYTANYAYHVFAGANGQQPKPWVTLAAQRWPQIVDEVSARVRQRLGL